MKLKRDPSREEEKGRREKRRMKACLLQTAPAAKGRERERQQTHHRQEALEKIGREREMREQEMERAAGAEGMRERERGIRCRLL